MRGLRKDGEGGRGPGSLMALRPAAAMEAVVHPTDPSSECPPDVRPVQRRAGGGGGCAGGAGVTDRPLAPFSDPVVPWDAPARRLRLWEQVVPGTHRLYKGVCWAPEPSTACPLLLFPPRLPRLLHPSSATDVSPGHLLHPFLVPAS